MNGITELALLFKSCENEGTYSPVFGRILELPSLKVGIGDKVILTGKNIKQIVPVDQKNEYGKYINLNREVVLLPYAGMQKYILIGVVM